jgi:hypothetical protein
LPAPTLSAIPVPTEAPQALGFDPEQIVNDGVTLGGQMNETFHNQFKNQTFDYEGIVARHNRGENLVIFKGGNGGASSLGFTGSRSGLK